MSKKMAEGIDALVLDVKTGDGAFMKSLRGLARAGRGHGRHRPRHGQEGRRPDHGHGAAAGPRGGNALEIAECIETLKGRGPADLEELSVELAAWMLQPGRRGAGLEAARVRVREALASGRRAAEVPGGHRAPGRRSARLRRHRAAAARARRRSRSAAESARDRHRASAAAPSATRRCCWAPGRETVDSRIDPAVGFVLHKKVGDAVAPGEPLVTLHVNDRAREKGARAAPSARIRIGAAAPTPTSSCGYGDPVSAMQPDPRACAGSPSPSWSSSGLAAWGLQAAVGPRAAAAAGVVCFIAIVRVVLAEPARGQLAHRGLGLRLQLRSPSSS